MVANLAALEALDKAIHEHDSSTSESVTGSVDSVQRMPDLLVESTNNKGQQLQQGQSQFLAFSEEQNNNKINSVIQSKVYASVSEMKRMKVTFADLFKYISCRALVRMGALGAIIQDLFTCRLVVDSIS